MTEINLLGLNEIEDIIHIFQNETNKQINVLLIPFFSVEIIESDFKEEESNCYVMHSQDGTIIPFNFTISKNETRLFRQLALDEIFKTSLGCIEINEKNLLEDSTISFYENDVALNICCTIYLDNPSTSATLSKYVRKMKNKLIKQSQDEKLNLVYIPLQRLFEISNPERDTYLVSYKDVNYEFNILDGILLDQEISSIYEPKSRSDIPLVNHPFQKSLYNSIIISAGEILHFFEKNEYNCFELEEE